MKAIMLLLAFTCATMVFSQDAPKQCKGITTKNVQCKNRAKQGDYCHIHNPDSPRCGVTTSKGQPCKRQVKVKGEHCWQHAGK